MNAHREEVAMPAETLQVEARRRKTANLAVCASSVLPQLNGGSVQGADDHDNDDCRYSLILSLNLLPFFLAKAVQQALCNTTTPLSNTRREDFSQQDEYSL